MVKLVYKKAIHYLIYLKQFCLKKISLKLIKSCTIIKNKKNLQTVAKTTDEKRYVLREKLKILKQIRQTRLKCFENNVP